MSEAKGIWIFHTGRIRIRRSLLEAGGQREVCWQPVLCFLILHPNGPVLVDSGYGRRMLERRELWWGRLLGGALRFTFSQGMDCRSRILQCGVDPNEVERGLLTHMHFDHTGGIGDLDNTTFYVPRTELNHALSQNGLRGIRHGYLSSDYRHAPNLKPFEWDPADDMRPFDRHYDVYGDGAIRAFPTPGHTPGHLSVLVRLPDDRQALITGDAAFTGRHLDSGMGLGLLPRQFSGDRQEAEHTLHKLRDFASRIDPLVVLTSHDPDLGDDVANEPLRMRDLD